MGDYLENGWRTVESSLELKLMPLVNCISPLLVHCLLYSPHTRSLLRYTTTPLYTPNPRQWWAGRWDECSRTGAPDSALSCAHHHPSAHHSDELPSSASHPALHLRLTHPVLLHHPDSHSRWCCSTARGEGVKGAGPLRSRVGRSWLRRRTLEGQSGWSSPESSRGGGVRRSSSASQGRRRSISAISAMKGCSGGLG